MGRTDLRSRGLAWLLALVALSPAACSDREEAQTEAAAAGAASAAGPDTAPGSGSPGLAATQVQRSPAARSDLPYGCPAEVVSVPAQCSPAAAPEAGRDWLTSCPEGVQPDPRCRSVALD